MQALLESRYCIPCTRFNTEPSTTGLTPSPSESRDSERMDSRRCLARASASQAMATQKGGRYRLFFAAPFCTVPLGVRGRVKSQAPDGTFRIGPEPSTTGPDFTLHIRVPGSRDSDGLDSSRYLARALASH